MTTPTDAAARPLPFRTAGVVGAGVMGAQIAGHLANVGLTVELLDMPSEDGPKSGLVESLFDRASKLKPPPFFTPDVADRIRLGNFEEHWDRLADVDWVVEVVLENMEVKRDVAKRLDATVSEHAVISTNTSGLPIHRIIDGCSESFRRRFLGTHFFNPPRYMKLLELVPTPDTSPEVLARVSEFGRLALGKGVVVAKDTPNFIANRIGVHAILQTIRRMGDGGYGFHDVDQLTGPLIGRPRSATLRTCDVVGLDTMAYVAQNLWGAVEDDESRDAFLVPEVLQALVDAGALGAKVGRGFYKKEGKHILCFDPATGDYAAPGEPELDLAAVKRAGGLVARMRALYDDPGRAGQLFRDITQDTLAYSARRVPEITDNPADLDRAIRWGFGYEIGPFQTWDALGFERVRDDLVAAGHELPSWVEELAGSEARSFYAGTPGRETVFVPGAGHTEDIRPADEISLAVVAASGSSPIWENDSAALLDLGDGVPVFEFRSKANTLGGSVMTGLRECLAIVEDGPYHGLVIGNDGEHFSPGANLVEMVDAATRGAFDEIDAMIARFQSTIQCVAYATKPVVMALRGRVFGGACEMLMACRHAVASAESYIGLVETGAGLIPGGGGTMRMAAWAAERALRPDPEHIGPWLQAAFETVARATVSSSAHHAQRLGFLSPGACVIANADRRLFVARAEVLRLSEEGYLPPPERLAVPVLGSPARQRIEAGLREHREAGRIDEHAEFVAARLAWVLTGGDLDGPGRLTETQLLDLERQAFVELLRDERTRQRIVAIVGPPKSAPSKQPASR